MESPSQMIYGLGAFLIAFFITMLLCFLCPMLSIFQDNLQLMGCLLGSGFFCFWWIAYIKLVGMERRKRNEKNPKLTK